jgi:structural maintenance of chromosome 2
LFFKFCRFARHSPPSPAEIGPFDKSFNAITGKNGSGKSNILDAIMFVFGATRAGQLRVKDFSSLVYKEGATDVKRASVTIVFNNSDRETSPAGYEDQETFFVTRTVKHGDGTSKYMINGSVATQAKVHALFHSVQLNIDNPTFLVQQGQITKVVNMKPLEVLSMLEEATGVRLYEDQKAKALKTLTQRQLKLDEMDKMLREEITPTLEKRRAESEQYNRWLHNGQIVDRKRRLVDAHRYHEQFLLLEKSRETEEALQSEELALRTAASTLVEQLKECKREHDKLMAQRAKDAGQEYADLEMRESELSKEKVLADSEIKYQTKMLQEENANIETLSKSAAELQSTIERKRAGQTAASADFDALTQELHHLQQQVVSLGQRMEAAEAGVATGAGDATGSLTDQLMTAKQTQSKAHTLLQQLTMQIKANQKELKEKSAQVSADGAKMDEVTNKTNLLVKEKAAIQARLQALSFEPERQQALMAERERLQARVREIGAEMDALAVQTQGGLEYRYARPRMPGFRESMVHGRLGKLLTVKDPEACVALEMVAGAKVRNVVVDTAEVAKELLDCNKGQRTTFIPLDKIRSDPITEKARKARQIVGPQNADLATNFVEFDPAVKPAMDYVFGRTIVCKENIHAKEIAFNSDSSVVAHCVTYDGDVFDPSGTLTGGSKGSVGQTLATMTKFKTLEHELHEVRARLAQVDAELAGLEGKSREYASVSRELKLKDHELGLLQEKMQTSSSHQLVMRTTQLQAELERDQKQVAETTKEEAAAGKRAKELELLIKDFASTKDTQIKEMKKEIATNKKTQAELKTRLSATREKKDTLVAELGALQEELQGVESQLDVARRTAKGLEVSSKEAKSAGEVVHARFDAARAALAKKRELLEQCDKQLSGLAQRQNLIQSQMGSNEVKVKELERRVQQFNKSNASARTMIERMQADHPWIRAESQFFGKAGTEFDFSVNDPRRAEAELAALMREQQKLEGTINKKVAAMISEADRKYNDVQDRKAIVERDKAKILESIEDLDRRKVEALDKTYDAVNKVFGNLYSKFLPVSLCVIPCYSC